MPNQIGPQLEQRMLAFALARPGLGPRRVSVELGREKWGGIRISARGVWRVLRRLKLNTRSKRLALVARHAEPYEREPQLAPPERHIDAAVPGEKVQLDCFFVGRLSGSRGTVWQYTAADVASGFVWAELHASERNPWARWTVELVHRVARELKGGRLDARPGPPPITAPSSPRASSARPADRGCVDFPCEMERKIATPPSRDAGAPPSRARSRPSSPRCAATWPNSSTNSTTTAPTTAASPKPACPQISSTAPARSEP
jgi:hypothetical protein